MSAGVYANINGVTRKGKKLYAKVNGVVRPIKELWVKDNGVARKIYQNAITWTYVIDDDGVRNGKDLTFDAGWAVEVRGSITYTFNNGNGFLMHAGQTLNYVFSARIYAGSVAVYINGSELDIPSAYTTGDADGEYTFPADTKINTIRINGWAEANAWAQAKVTINSDYGSFLLNNSGKSN